MASTPVSMNNESLNGSWIDIANTSSPAANNSLGPIEPSQPSDPVQNIGLISFQVERFLQEARGNQSSTSNPQKSPHPAALDPDDNSGIYLSDSDVSVEHIGARALIDTLKQQQLHQKLNDKGNSYAPQSSFYHKLDLSKSQESFADFQLSDSLSFISRISGLDADTYGLEQAPHIDDFDWLWDWTWQPEFFSGQEWKICTPKQDYLMRQRQLCSTSLHKNQRASLFSGDMISLLFLTNILSIIIGAGITYSILMRKSSA